MEFNKSVSNPMLVGCIELMKAEDTPEHRNMFIGEVTKASFMAPAVIEPEPQEDAEGRPAIVPGSKVQFPMLSAGEGKHFFMAFTDEGEYVKWVEKAPKRLPVFALRFEDYAAMLLGKDSQGKMSPALGVVINPYGANIMLPREMVAGIMSARMAQAQRVREARGEGQAMPPRQGQAVPPVDDRP